MCGIAGIMALEGQPVFENEVRHMCKAMLHRGPDQDGFWSGDGIGLGMRRLSIIDLASGRQPIRNEDGSVTVVLNGEIYNFAELRERLERQGHVFSTNTDTEVIVHLYEEHGKECVEHLRGMFGFALWDSKQRQLLLARDRLGIKPLYYAICQGRLIFASEMKAILQLPQVPRDLNWRAVGHLFSFLSTPTDESIITGIQKLEPGRLLVASPHMDPVIERYWSLTFEPDHSKQEEYFIGRLRELLDESVHLHMVSDVPLGAFLSGGIDSSAIVATAAKLRNEPIQTFSIGFREPEFNELGYARTVARKIGAARTELVLGPQMFGEVELEQLAWHLDEPFGDSSAIPTYMVSKLAAQHVKVVLSGDGGDELFAGYDRYVVEQRERAGPSLPQSLRSVLGGAARMMPTGMRGRNFLRHRSLIGAERYLDACTLFPRDDFGKLFSPAFSEMIREHDPWKPKLEHLRFHRQDWLAGLQSLDIENYLPLDILTKVDRMSMAHSIESRVPLLDHKIVEFAATIPAEMKLRGGDTKYIFKRAMEGILPNEILTRPKRGFAIPLGYWFRGHLRDYARDLLLGERARRRGVLNTAYVEHLLARQVRGNELDLQLWTVISFELWARMFLDAKAPIMDLEAA